MSLLNVPAGDKTPEQFNVIIEIAMNRDPVKYEIDKDTGALFVDRFVSTSMQYPANYGYIPQTLAGDGDPVDVLVLTPFALQPGAVVKCRALGMFKMQDESGDDAKLLAVPVDKVLPLYSHIKTLDDVSPALLKTIAHFFEHYKDLEAGKWVKAQGWEGIESAHKEIVDGIANYKK